MLAQKPAHLGVLLQKLENLVTAQLSGAFGHMGNRTTSLRTEQGASDPLNHSRARQAARYGRPMAVKRIKPNILSDDFESSREFYSEVIGLQEGEGLDWILLVTQHREG